MRFTCHMRDPEAATGSLFFFPTFHFLATYQDDELPFDAKGGGVGVGNASSRALEKLEEGKCLR